MREGLAGCPGYGGGRGARSRGTRGPLPTVQLLLILNSWHIMAIQPLLLLAQDTETPGRRPSRASVPHGNQRWARQGAAEDAVPTHNSVSHCKHSEGTDAALVNASEFKVRPHLCLIYSNMLAGRDPRVECGGILCL